MQHARERKTSIIVQEQMGMIQSIVKSEKKQDPQKGTTQIWLEPNHSRNREAFELTFEICNGIKSCDYHGKMGVEIGVYKDWEIY